MSDKVSREKQKPIEVLKSGHEEFRKIIERLQTDEIDTKLVVGKWSIRDVIAHVSAWYWEFIREIDGILANQPIINVLSGEEEFNERAVAARKGLKTKELIIEWEKSFTKLISRIENLQGKEWFHKCDGFYWPDGSEITMQSLFFSYQNDEVSHEMEHAKQIFDILHL